MKIIELFTNLNENDLRTFFLVVISVNLFQSIKTIRIDKIFKSHFDEYTL